MSKWLVGLGVWFSLWVREVPGSNPGRALEFFQSFAWRSFFWHLFSHNAVQNLEEVRFFLENRSQPSFVLIGFLRLWQVSLSRTSVRVKLLLLSCRQGNVKVTIKSKIKEESQENFPWPILSIEEMFQIHSEWNLRMQRYFSKQRWYDTKQVFSAETNEETLFANSLFAAVSQVFSFAASVFSRPELTDKNRLQIWIHLRHKVDLFCWDAKF